MLCNARLYNTAHIFTSNLIIVRSFAGSLIGWWLDGWCARDDDCDSAVAKAAAAACDVVVVIVVVVVHENPKIINAQKTGTATVLWCTLHTYNSYKPAHSIEQLSTSENRGRVDMAGQLV